jgi:hypothetical protein
MFSAMESALKGLCSSFTKEELLRLAEKFERSKGVRIDRSAQRLKDCLVCWFCENCPELLSPSPEGLVPKTSTPNTLPHTVLQTANFFTDIQMDFFECEMAE